jgi:hypothetical protein
MIQQGRAGVTLPLMGLHRLGKAVLVASGAAVVLVLVGGMAVGGLMAALC